MYRPDYVDTITILAGENEHPFTVHKNIICNRSPYFVAASSEAWQQQEEKGVVRLSSVDADTFTVYAHWIYTGAIDLDIVETEDKCHHREAARHNRKCERLFYSKILVKLYLAGDLLIDRKLKNVTMDKLLDHIQFCLEAGECPFSWNSVDRIWSNTADDSPLRKCVLDYFLTQTTETGFRRNNAEKINAQFLLDLCNRHFETGRTREYTFFKSLRGTADWYHEHEDSDKWCRCRC